MWNSISMFAQDEISPAAGAGAAIGLLVPLALGILMIVSLWKVFTKAGKPGWASIIPIYNMIVLLEIVGKPVWWIILMMIPLVNFIVVVLVFLELARRFGKSELFGVGLLLLGVVFFPILAFGDARYRG